MYRKELASIRKFGFVTPVIVRDMGTYYQIIDGEHRVRAAIELGLGEIPIFSVGVINDAVAKQLTIVLNETRGRADPKRLGTVLKDLLEEVEKTELLDLLPFSPPVFDRLTGAEVEDWGLPAAPSGASWVERTYRMPIEAANVLDQALAKAKDGEEIPEWQALELVAADFLSGS